MMQKLLQRRQFRGQGMVEFALVLPVLILILIGILEFGYFFLIYSTVNTAAREAARYAQGAGEPKPVAYPGKYYYQHCAGIREVATRIGRYAAIVDSNITIFYDDGPDVNGGGINERSVCTGTETYTAEDANLGQRIVVRVAVNYSPIIVRGQILGYITIFPDNMTIQAESARTIIKRLDVMSNPEPPP